MPTRPTGSTGPVRPTGPGLLAELRNAARWVIGAAAAAGVFWGGGYVGDEPGLSVAAPRPPEPLADERWVLREATRGVAELERFLARQPHG